MKKIALSKIRLITCLVLLCLVLVQSCRKDSLDLPSAEVVNLQQQKIDKATLVNWFATNPAAKLLTPDWKNAKQAVIMGKNVVRVPTLNVDKYAALNKNTSLKLNTLGGNNLQKGKTSNTSGQIGANINFYDQHPPEIFFVQESGKEELHNFLLNFVPTNPTKEFGQDSLWTGKLYEWNLTGDTLLVQEIVKSKLIKRYGLKISKQKDNEQGAKLGSGDVVTNLNGKKTSGAWADFWNNLWEDIAVIWGEIGNFFGVASWDYSVGYYVWDAIDWPAIGSFFNNVFGNGSGGGSSYGYTGSGSVIYSSYIPGYDPPGNTDPGTGGGGGGGWDPYPNPGGGGSGPSNPPVYSESLSYLVNYMLLTPAQTTFLMANDDIAYALALWFETNGVGTTPEAVAFAEWAVKYLMENPSRYDQSFKDLLHGVYNENSPIYIPDNFDIAYAQDWIDNEDEFALSTSLIQQEGISKFDPVPEMYYITSTPVNMTGAAPTKGYTVQGAPRNYNYFWKKLAALRPEMFSADNRAGLKSSPVKAPIIDDQWIKYNPTHAPYRFGKLVHHHDQQGFLAYAIPEKVHQKWHARLHAFRSGGKISGIRGKLLSLVGVMQNVFTQFTGWATGDPDAWINWFGGMNEVGKIYYHADKGVYFEITKKIETKDANGRVIRAKVNYDVYADHVWDSDEGRYMGVMKLGAFYEDIDVVNRTSYNQSFETM